MKFKSVFAAAAMGLALLMAGGAKIAFSAVWYNILTPPGVTPVGHLHLDDSSCGGTLAGCEILFGSGVENSPEFSFEFNASGVSLESSDLLAAFASFGTFGNEFHVNGLLSGGGPPENEIVSLPEPFRIQIAGIDIVYEQTDVVPTATPLPAALPMYGSALALIGFLGWRKRRRAQ